MTFTWQAITWLSRLAVISDCHQWLSSTVVISAVSARLESAIAIGHWSMHYGTKPGHFETSKIHFPTSERTSEWPSTYVSILVYPRPQCNGLDVFHNMPHWSEVLLVSLKFYKLVSCYEISKSSNSQAAILRVIEGIQMLSSDPNRETLTEKPA